MDRTHKFLMVLTFVVVGLVGYLAYDTYTTRYPSVPGSFQVSADQVPKDLIGKAVTLPQGQLWGFNNDQTITAKVVDKKAVDGGVVVIADVNSTVKFEPAKDAKDKAKEPTKATLSGYVKMYYENVNNQWFLTHVDGLNLKVTAE
jgi:hypothetical protein